MRISLEDCFKRDLKAELMPNAKARHRLKPDAVPTIFSYKQGTGLQMLVKSWMLCFMGSNTIILTCTLPLTTTTLRMRTPPSIYSVTKSELMDTDCETDDEMQCSPPKQQQKFIVFENKLDELFKCCPKCQQPVIRLEKVVTGTMLTVKYVCLQGHVDSWQSQPTLNGMPAGNLLFSAAILFSGTIYAKAAHLCAIFNLAIMKERTFHTVQSKYLFPMVHQTWNYHQQDHYRRFSGQPLAVSGGGCCDSPGYNAKYCTYTMIYNDGAKDR